MNKLKILTVVCDLKKGGTQRAAQVFAEAYNELDYDSRVLAAYENGSRYDELKNKILIWTCIDNANLSEIKKWNPEIIHIHSHGLKPEDVGKLIGLLKKENTMVVETNVFSSPSSWENKIDYSFQLSSWAAWLYIMRGGSINKAKILPNPINCSQFKKADVGCVNKFKDYYKIPRTAFVLGRIGQSHPGKWSLMLISAFNKIAKNNPNVYLVIVNPPTNIIKAAEKSNFKNRIIHIDKIIGDEKLATAYSSFDLMVHAAEKGESFGYVLAESILCGTPIITLNTPWADNSQAEVVQHLKGGYVVNSEKGLISAILNYIKSPKKIKIDSGDNHVTQKYNHIKVAKDVLNCVLNNESALNIKEVKNNLYELIKKACDKPSPITAFVIKHDFYILRRVTLHKYPFKYLKTEFLKRFNLKK